MGKFIEKMWKRQRIVEYINNHVEEINLITGKVKLSHLNEKEVSYRVKPTTLEIIKGILRQDIEKEIEKELKEGIIDRERMMEEV